MPNEPKKKSPKPEDVLSENGENGEQNIEAKVSSRADELLDMAEKQAGVSAIQKVVNKHLQQIETLRSQFPLDNIDLITSNLVQKKDVIGAVSSEITKLHEKIKFIIVQVSETIENRKYKGAEEAVEDMPLSYNELDKANSLVSADKKRLISCQALNFTMEVFSKLNKLIEKQISESENDNSREGNLLLGNAILVYEMTDFVINYIKNFKVQGIEELTFLYTESNKKTNEIMLELENLEELAGEEGIDQATKESTLQDIGLRRKAVEMIKAEWGKLIEENNSLQKEVNTVKGNLPTLQLIRANAKSQINILEAIKVLQIVKNSLGALNGALKALGDVKLVSLSPDRIRRLLGIRNGKS